jgi:hypothetical protein
MKFNFPTYLALSFFLTIFGTSFAMPMMAEMTDEMMDDNKRLLEENSEDNFSSQTPETLAELPIKSPEKSLVHIQSQSSKYISLHEISEIDDWRSATPSESATDKPVTENEYSSPNGNSKNQVLSIAALPKLGKASQLAQSYIAQTSDDPFGFRNTRGGPSYLGIGGNFGSRSDFAVISKIGLNNSFSLRPSVLLLNNFVTVLVPFTYDFAPQPFLNPDLILAPYLGGGLAFKTSSDSTIGGLITAGVDLPISQTFTVNIATNLTFLNQTELGIILGIAYNF